MIRPLVSLGILIVCPRAWVSIRRGPLLALSCLAVQALGCATSAPTSSSGAATAMASSADAGSTAPREDAGEAAAPSHDLRFRGTVTAIGISGTDEDPMRRWVVTMNVEEVLSGAFTERTFAFGIHSPVKSGLAVGGSYTVEAKWTGTGYLVDQHQWRRR